MEDPHDDIEHADRRMRDAEREIEELGLSAQKYEEVESDWQDLLKDTSKDKALERFRLEYEKLHKTLMTSHENEKKLIKRCKELNMEISSLAVKVQIALKLNHDDNNAIDQTKNDVERTWKLVDQTREKEEVLKKKLAAYKHELEELRRRIETDDTAPFEQQQQLEEYKKELDKILELKEESYNKLKDLRTINGNLMEKVNKLEQEKDEANSQLSMYKETTRKNQEEARSQETRKKELDKEIETIKQENQEKCDSIKQQEAEREEIKREIEDIGRSIATLSLRKSEDEAKIYDMRTKNKGAHENLRDQQQRGKKLADESNILHSQLEKIRESFAAKRDDNKRKEKEIIVMKKKIAQITQDRAYLETQKDKYKGELQLLNQQNLELRRENDADRKKIESVVRDINKMNKNCIDLENKTRFQDDEIVMRNNELRKITNELKASRKEITKLSALIYQLKRDQDKYSLESTNAYSKFVQTGEQVKIKNSMIAQLQKENVEAEAKLKQQQNLYEAARSDRNLYSKNLLESDSQKEELKRKYNMLTYQISKLRDEISTKNDLIRMEREKFALEEEKNDKDKKDKDKLKEKNKDKEKYIKEYENEINQLKYYISEAEQEKLKQKKEYEMVINDRNILSSQLIKRNEELATLYEKIKIQQSTLAKGEVSYQERVIKSDLLRRKITQMKKEYIVSTDQVSCVTDLSREINLLEKELMEARTKVKALSEELQNPMNVHRYRKLEGTSPETYEMILKIQTLNRRLIAKTEEVAEKEFLIQEKEKLYLELKNILARQPKPEVAEQLTAYKENIKEKTKQMKQMIEELNGAHAQVNLHKFEIERFNNEIRKMKEDWFNAQRKSKALPIIPEEV